MIRQPTTMKRLLIITCLFVSLNSLLCQTITPPHDIHVTIVDKMGKAIRRYSFSGVRYDTVKAILSVSSVFKKVSPMWTIQGYVIYGAIGTEPRYLGRKKKPIPSYIHVWDFVKL